MAGEGSNERDIAACEKEIDEELRRRQNNLEVIDKEIAEIEHQLSQSKEARTFLNGDAGTISSCEAFKAALRAKLKRKSADRRAALEQVHKVLERKQSLEEELKG